MKTIDLTTLQGWNDLPDGTYAITVGATAEGYTRIKQSNAVSVTKETAEEYFLTFSSAEPFTVFAFPDWDGELEYSTDKETWNTWSDEEISSGSNNELYLRGIGNTSIGTNFEFFGDDNISCTGNIENLLDYETVELGNHPVMANDCFSSLFAGAPLTTAPRLPATTLAQNCYGGMFDGCTSLTTAPSLPAMNLAQSCYQSMFAGCTSLTTAPQLPATTLAQSCYMNMFMRCASLTTAPALPAMNLGNSCYSQMFAYCTSLTTAPSLPATTLAQNCYSSMFMHCTSLTTIPAFPATNMANSCYYQMFYNCTSIKISETQTGEYQNVYRIPTSGTGIDASNWSTYMFEDTGGTFTSAPAINTTYYTSNAIINSDGTITPAVQGV